MQLQDYVTEVNIMNLRKQVEQVEMATHSIYQDRLSFQRIFEVFEVFGILEEFK